MTQNKSVDNDFQLCVNYLGLYLFQVIELVLKPESQHNNLASSHFMAAFMFLRKVYFNKYQGEKILFWRPGKYGNHLLLVVLVFEACDWSSCCVIGVPIVSNWFQGHVLLLYPCCLPPLIDSVVKPSIIRKGKVIQGKPTDAIRNMDVVLFMGLEWLWVFLAALNSLSL